MKLANHKRQFFVDNFNYYINFKKKLNNNLVALITPHAGLSYCGELLQYAYSQINWDKFNKVILLSTHHNYWNSMPESKIFSLSEDLILNIDDFVGLDLKKSDDDCLDEHSWLVQMPFLLGKNLKVCIILIGKYDENIVNNIYKNLDDETLLLANTDLLHCGPNFNIDCPDDDDIDKYNNDTIEKIKSMEMKSDLNSMCGYSAIRTFLEILKRKNNIKKKEHKYFTSKKIDAKSKNSVGYASILFYNKNTTKYPINYTGGLFKTKINILNIPRKTIKFFKKYKKNIGILNIPRKTIELMFEIYNDGISRDGNEENKINYCYNKFLKKYTWDKLNNLYGIFVTINDSKNRLRGCIGNFDPKEAGQSIVMQTLESAVIDTRFEPLNKYEYQSLKYKVNFLKESFTVYEKNNKYSPLESLSVMEFSISKGHGITITFNNGRRSTYLSSVLPEHFGINNYNDLKKNWNELLLSMYNKANRQNYNNIDLKIKKIDLYYCREYDENQLLTLK
jgi:AmmeMemoRadiSam system protein B